MKISDVMLLNDGTPGIEVTAKLVRVYESTSYNGSYGPFTVQNLEIDDNTGKITCSLFNKTVPENALGQIVTILNGNKGSYKDKPKLEVKKDGRIVIRNSRNVDEQEPNAEEVPEPETREERMSRLLADCLQEAEAFFKCPEISPLLEYAKGEGWSSEDVRAVLISRMIENSRRK